MTPTDFNLALRGLTAEDFLAAMEAFDNEVYRQYTSGERLSKEEGEQKLIAAVCAKVPRLALKETLERGRTIDHRIFSYPDNSQK